MRRLRDILRLKYDAGLAHRAIAQACTVGLGTVSAVLARATAAGLTWPLPDGLDDATLEARLFARPANPALDRTVPEWAHLHQELKRPGVTLQLLWTEYRAAHPTGYAYSHFCERYRRWAAVLKPSMRQVHRAGDKTFVDFSGTRPSLVDAATGLLVPVELFVGVLGASGLIYAEATCSQDLACWVGAHVHMVEYLGGSTAIWVPDNLKSGVTTANYYEPEVNRTYADLASHYGAIVLPARAAHPRDKPKVEVSVQIAQRWILAVLRHRAFFTLADLNAAIRTCLTTVNDRPMQILGVSRRGLFEQLDRPALRPLPRTPYELATWKPCRVNLDYHVEVDHNWYSVPYQLIHQKVEARATATTVEVFLKGRRLASHARRRGRHQYATDPAHMPRAHRAHAEWTPSRLIGWAEQTGAATGRLVAGILERRPHPEQGYRACLGLMRLGRVHGMDRLDAACARAERLRSYRYRTVEHILTHQQDRLPLDEPASVRPALLHENVRGATYYEEVYADTPDDREAPRATPDGDGHG
ncbi:MAG TPA: IS21 family transposase, partial [Vicinamibacterales bacterium]